MGGEEAGGEDEQPDRDAHDLVRQGQREAGQRDRDAAQGETSAAEAVREPAGQRRADGAGEVGQEEQGRDRRAEPQRRRLAAGTSGSCSRRRTRPSAGTPAGTAGRCRDRRAGRGPRATCSRRPWSPWTPAAGPAGSSRMNTSVATSATCRRGGRPRRATRCSPRPGRGSAVRRCRRACCRRRTRRSPCRAPPDAPRRPGARRPPRPRRRGRRRRDARATSRRAKNGAAAATNVNRHASSRPARISRYPAERLGGRRQRQDRQGERAGGRGHGEAGRRRADPEVGPDRGEERLGRVEHPERGQRREEHGGVETSELPGPGGQAVDRALAPHPHSRYGAFTIPGRLGG